MPRDKRPLKANAQQELKNSEISLQPNHNKHYQL